MTTPIRRHFTTAVFLLLVSAAALRADPHKPHASAHSIVQHATPPAPGSAERKKIMDALRVRTLKMLGGTVPGAGSNQIVFVVRHLKVDRGWAFVTVDPKSADGKWGGDTFSELLHKVNGRWTAVATPSTELDENISEAKSMSRFRAQHPQAPRDIY